MRFKGLPHEWIPRNAGNEADFTQYARLPIIPLVVTPQGEALQDSTPIIERLEASHPEPTLYPAEEAARFVSALLEEFGDEWGNKWMFHYRWARDLDQRSAAGRIARVRDPSAGEDAHAKLSEAISERMVSRLSFVGSNAQTAAQIESSFIDSLALLDRHLSTRLYIFGARPALGDFGLWAQLYETWTDPTSGALIGSLAPNLLDWIHRMLHPRVEGEFEPWTSLEPTLLEFLAAQVGALFMPWTLANEIAVRERQAEFSVELKGGNWTQKPQSYHAKSFAALKAKYSAVADKHDLNQILEKADCRFPV